jgi:hypothetical protein
MVVTLTYFFSFYNLKDLATKLHLLSHEIINPALSNTVVAKSLILCLGCGKDSRRISFGTWPENKTKENCTVAWKLPYLERTIQSNVSTQMYP